MFPKLTPILEYLESLEGRASLTTLQGLLAKSEMTSKDVASACAFHDGHYARNKISGTAWYDLYIMCWKPGQTSAIHDHTDSSCAFRILEGTATEFGCEMTDSDHRYVKKTYTTHFTAGQVCAAQDSQIHQIANTSTQENLVTMHIYSPPLKMSVYEIDPRGKGTAELAA